MFKNYLNRIVNRKSYCTAKKYPCTAGVILQHLHSLVHGNELYLREGHK